MERLTSEQLKDEHKKTPISRRMRYGPLARLLFVSMDLLYGRRKTLSKFKVLEIIARVPYQAWENVAYVAITHTHPDPGFARRIFDRVRESRLQQDNEQWHFLILQELTAKRALRENLLLHGFIPQVIAFIYYHIAWILYVIGPKWSYLLNAYFEDHAEHEYMEYVAENWRESRLRVYSKTIMDGSLLLPISSARSVMMSGCTSWRAWPGLKPRAFSNPNKSCSGRTNFSNMWMR